MQWLLPIIAFLSIPAAVSGQTFIKLSNGQVIPGSASTPVVTSGKSTPIAPMAAVSCGSVAVAKNGQPIPGGGSLSLGAFMDPAPCTGPGKVAFMSWISGSPRNQAIFWADAGGIHPIAFGSGNGGGGGLPGSAGDPSPIGGKFAGFFNGTFFAPAMNEAGDVLFLADIYLGSSPRGLFLYRGTTQTIVKVAAVGDPAPGGGTLAAVGPGSLNDLGTVVFLAERTGGNVDILKYSGGTVSTVAAVGEAAPSQGSYAWLGGESVGFVDGTSMPTGPVPAIDNAGTVAFRAITNLGTSGIIMKSAGSAQWYVQSGTAAPGGGTYIDFQSPNLNQQGQVSFFADLELSPGSYTSGWYAGKPGAWRKVVRFLDSIGTGQCIGLTFSRNPVQSIDDAGNVVVWVTLMLPGGSQIERVILSTPQGSLVDVATQGAPTPIGGTYGPFDILPALSASGAITWGGFTLGTPDGTSNARFVAPKCGPSITSVTPPFGPTTGGGTVVIDGTGFTSATDVRFGSVPASFTIVNDTRVSATLPAAAAQGVVDVSVTTPTGTALAPSAFHYFVKPADFGAASGSAELSWESSTAPIAGMTLQFNVENAPIGSTMWGWAGESNVTWGGLTLPLDLTPFGIPGGEILASGEYPLVAGSSILTLSVPIPNNRLLIGMHFYFQAIVLEGGSSVLSITNAYEIVIAP
ncbi:MAG: IPT/TIG domain-containing protein [Planctomycetes bacterium]|nr:IPT/TIG domain-containing protein [Planctomycetota bacterium]